MQRPRVSRGCGRPALCCGPTNSGRRGAHQRTTTSTAPQSYHNGQNFKFHPKTKRPFPIQIKSKHEFKYPHNTYSLIENSIKILFELVNVLKYVESDIFDCLKSQKGLIIFWAILWKIVHCAVSSRRELWHFFQRGRSAEWLESLWHTKRGPPWLSKAASKKARKHCRGLTRRWRTLLTSGKRLPKPLSIAAPPPTLPLPPSPSPPLRTSQL